MIEKGNKKEVTRVILEKLKASGYSNLVFDNKLVKEISGGNFSNQFDATKFDSSNLLPSFLQQEDYFIVHLGHGSHQFVKGISYGYHKFETVPPN